MSIDLTYQKLFAAQRNTVPSTSPSNSFIASQQDSPVFKRSNAQASLHDFWHLPQRPNISNLDNAATNNLVDFQRHPRCQDCEADLGWLLNDDSVTFELGVDDIEYGATNYICRVCGRMICDMCAVISIEQGRECLECKTSRKRWVGGIGWIPPAYL